MKPQLSSPISTPVLHEIRDNLGELWSAWCRKKLPSYLFLALCCNTFFAPAVWAATGGEFSRFQAWATALLGMATVSLSAYLFVVMFQPEKF
jgi:F subunit of K+-transporting ATPase (Potass_KdpF)